MKKNLLYFLLLIPFIAISQPTSLPNANDIYKGLVAGDECRFKALPICEKAAKDLNTIIQDQSYFIIDLTTEFQKLQKSKDSLFQEKEKVSVTLQKLQDKKVPFYRNPWYYLIAGFIGGAFTFK